MWKEVSISLLWVFSLFCLWGAVCTNKATRQIVARSKWLGTIAMQMQRAGRYEDAISLLDKDAERYLTKEFYAKYVFYLMTFRNPAKLYESSHNSQTSGTKGRIGSGDNMC